MTRDSLDGPATCFLMSKMAWDRLRLVDVAAVSVVFRAFVIFIRWRDWPPVFIFKMLSSDFDNCSLMYLACSKSVMKCFLGVSPISIGEVAQSTNCGVCLAGVEYAIGEGVDMLCGITSLTSRGSQGESGRRESVMYGMLFDTCNVCCDCRDMSVSSS